MNDFHILNCFCRKSSGGIIYQNVFLLKSFLAKCFYSIVPGSSSKPYVWIMAQKIRQFIKSTDSNIWVWEKNIYRKITSSNTSHLEAHAGFFRLLKKGIFNPYVLWLFDKKLISKLVMRVRMHDYTVVWNTQCSMAYLWSIRI